MAERATAGDDADADADRDPDERVRLSFFLRYLVCVSLLLVAVAVGMEIVSAVDGGPCRVETVVTRVRSDSAAHAGRQLTERRTATCEPYGAQGAPTVLLLAGGLLLLPVVLAQADEGDTIEIPGGGRMVKGKPLRARTRQSVEKAERELGFLD